MSPARFRPLGCDEVGELAPEFALGLLDGAERAAVVAHLERCRACRSQVALLAEAGEQMLLVAPSAEPPPGFEQRVLDRLGVEGPRAGSGPWARLRPRPRSRFRSRSGPGRGPDRRRRWLAPAVAVTAAALLALGGAAAVLRSGDPTGSGRDAEVANPDAGNEPGTVDRPEHERHTARLLSTRSRRDVGGVVVVESDPRVVEVDLAEWMARVAAWDEPPPGPWKLEVERIDGTQEQHILALADDPRPRIPLRPGGAAVASVAISDGTGRIWCEASL
ncbi:MAG TPA: zf-HC2 domain-containing protein [Acidimicrobiales bacterium]